MNKLREKIEAAQLSIEDFLPHVLPPEWLDDGAVRLGQPGGFFYARRYRQENYRDTFTVLVSLDEHPTLEGVWLRSSCARRQRLPSWGTDCRRARSRILPQRSRHQVRVNAAIEEARRELRS